MANGFTGNGYRCTACTPETSITEEAVDAEWSLVKRLD
jgi:hypothetical protein